MAEYYVNKNAQSNGDHEVHNADYNCPKPAYEANRHYLGDFPSCHGAVRKAKETYPQSNGCKHCSLPCNTG